LESETKISAKEIKNSSKDGASAKSDESINSIDDKTPTIDTQTKNQDDKDSQKQKFTEIIKNTTVQNSTKTNNLEIEKLKMFTEFKTPNETTKTIRLSEIIPEFSKAMQQNEKQSLTFQLTPDNLGKVKLVIDLVQNQINTRIVVENEQIKQFIQDNVVQLKQTLSSSGVDLNSVNISLADHEQKSNKSFSTRKKINNKLESINPDDDQQIISKKAMGYNTYEYLV
jgi:flagellar hook-length control protein FliK